jgi:hypothetical protein
VNPEAILALIAEMYTNLQRAGARIAELEKQIAAASPAPEPSD